MFDAVSCAATVLTMDFSTTFFVYKQSCSRSWSFFSSLLNLCCHLYDFLLIDWRKVVYVFISSLYFIVVYLKIQSSAVLCYLVISFPLFLFCLPAPQVVSDSIVKRLSRSFERHRRLSWSPWCSVVVLSSSLLPAPQTAHLPAHSLLIVLSHWCLQRMADRHWDCHFTGLHIVFFTECASASEGTFAKHHPPLPSFVSANVCHA